MKSRQFRRACEKMVRRVLGVVGLGGSVKHGFYRDIRGMGIEVVLFASSEEVVPEHLADHVIQVDQLFDHSQDAKHSASLVASLAKSQLRLDGIITFWEECGPLAALIGDVLGLRSIGYQNALCAKSKLRTQLALNRAKTHGSASLGARTVPCVGPEAFEIGFREIGLPMLYKIEHGCAAAGVYRIESEEDLIRAIGTHRIMRDDGSLGIGLSFGGGGVLTEYLVGSEHDVDIVMWNGSVKAAFTADNGRTGTDFFSETYAHMPSKLGANELIDTAERACQTLGLASGVFNIEMIRLLSGEIKVIDVNARMGGFYIRDWIAQVWNYDLLEAAVSVALGEEPKSQTNASGCIAGIMLLPSKVGPWLEAAGNIEALKSYVSQKNLRLNIFESKVEYLPGLDLPWGNVAAVGTTHDEALATLKQFVVDSSMLGNSSFFLDIL